MTNPSVINVEPNFFREEKKKKFRHLLVLTNPLHIAKMSASEEWRDEDGDFDQDINEEDIVEVIEGDDAQDGDDVPMEDDDEDEEQVLDDDRMDSMLDGGLDDSTGTFSGHASSTNALKTTDALDVEADKAVFCVAVHPDPLARICVSGGGDERARIWKLDDSQKQVVELTGHEDSVTNVGWSADGQLVATGGMDGRVRVWRRVGKTNWDKWEFLTNLEGPDEVTVSLFLFFFFGEGSHSSTTVYGMASKRKRAVGRQQ